MDFKGFVDKAKDAAAAAAAKAKEVGAAAAEQARTAGLATAAPLVDPTAPVGDASNELAPLRPDTALGAPDGASAPTQGYASQKLAELAAVGADQLQKLMNSFQQALPAIKVAGYELTEFEIELGVTPKLIPHFRHATRSAEDVDAARESLKDNKLGQIILGALLKAGEVHKQIKVAGYGFSHIEIEMGLIPSVRLQYKNEAMS